MHHEEGPAHLATFPRVTSGAPLQDGIAPSAAAEQNAARSCRERRFELRAAPTDTQIPRWACAPGLRGVWVLRAPELPLGSFRGGRSWGRAGGQSLLVVGAERESCHLISPIESFPLAGRAGVHWVP